MTSQITYECNLYDADTYQETGELMLIGTMDIQGEPELERIIKDEAGIEMQIIEDITPLDVVKAEEDEDAQYRTANLVVMYMESV